MKLNIVHGLIRRNRMKKKRLSGKIIGGFVLLSSLITAASCLIGYVRYTKTIEKMYNDKACNIANTVYEYLDGDLIGEYRESFRNVDGDERAKVAEKIMSEPEYQRMLAYIETFREKMDANYIYVADMTDNSGALTSDMTYLFDADNPKDDFDPYKVGDIVKDEWVFPDELKYMYEKGLPADNYYYSHSDFGYNTSGIVPIKNSKDKVVAVIAVELTMQSLIAARMRYITFVVLLSILITFLILLISAIYYKRSLIDPIETITDEVSRFVESETEVSEKLSEIKTGDEIETLSQSVLRMEISINEYIDNITRITAEKERIGAELNVATQIQANMLPRIFPPFPNRGEFDLYATMEPAKEVGGDFYDFFMIDNDHVALVIADVSGKGVPAALFMVIAKTLLKNQASVTSSPAEILAKVNMQLCENNDAQMFVTVWLVIYEISTGKVRAANAGHEYPALRRADGSFELLKDKHGFVLGGMEGLRFTEYEFEIEPGGSLFVYTDGVAEATDTANKLFGTDRMLDALNKEPDAAPKELISNVKNSIDGFIGEAPQFDDTTMLCIKRKL